jgi:predicted dehydrogenase
MIEKPMCINRKELMKIKNSKSLKKVLVQCNFILREYPRFKKIKSLVLSKKFGNIFFIEISYMHFIEKKITFGWRRNIPNYSTLLGGGIHLLDQLFYIFQDIKINSFVGFSNKIATKNTDFLYKDTYENLLKLDSGTIVRLFSSFSTKRPKLHAINIYGTKGSLENRDDGLYIYKDDNLKKFGERRSHARGTVFLF